MKNKTALITGASSGIGKEIAFHLAKQNIKVCINYLNSKKEASKTKQLIEKNGGTAIIYKADITQEKDVRKMFEFLRSEFNILDILVNNAGIYMPDFIESHDYNNWKKIIDVNLNGKFLCTKYAIPLLKKSLNPRIINIASRSGIRPDEESGAYCCAASAIIMLTQISALELAKYNIRINTVSPGLTRTPLTEKSCTKKEFNIYAKKNPSGRIGTPSDIAKAVSFLISDDAEFINGENINVSGGILLK